MARTTESHPRGSGTVVFEVDRVDQGDTRLEVSGRWFGVRGRRFVRPTLTFSLDDESFRLLADLEHKPWPAEDGAPWTAAFPWNGGIEGLREIELTVAPDISIELAGAGKPARGSARTGRVQNAHARAEAMSQEVMAMRQEVAAMRQEVAKMRRELDGERALSERLRGQLDPLRKQREADRREAQTVREELEHLRAAKVHSDALLARREAALAKLSEVETERDEARAAAERASTERDDLRREHRQTQVQHDRSRSSLAQLQVDLQAAGQAQDRAVAERDQALRVRDHALMERDRALAERDELARAGASTQSQRAAARSPVHRPNLVWRGSPWTTAGRSSAGGHTDASKREIGWGIRLMAIALLILALLLLVILLLVL